MVTNFVLSVRVTYVPKLLSPTNQMIVWWTSCGLRISDRHISSWRRSSGDGLESMFWYWNITPLDGVFLSNSDVELETI